MISHQKWSPTPFVILFLFVVFTTQIVQAQPSLAAVAPVTSFLTFDEENNIFFISFNNLPSSFSGSISISYFSPSRSQNYQQNYEIPSDLGSYITPNLPSVIGTSTSSLSWQNDGIVYQTSANLDDILEFSISMDLMFQSRIEVQIIDSTLNIIFDWSWDYAFVSSPIAFYYLYPSVRYDSNTHSCILTFHRIELVSPDRGLFIQVIRVIDSGSAAFLISSIANLSDPSMILTSYQSGAYFIVQFPDPRPSLSPVTLILALSFQDLIETDLVFQIMDIDPSHSDTASDFQANSAETVRLHNPFTSSPNPRIQLLTITPTDPTTTISSLFLWSLSILPTQETETLYIIPQFKRARESHIHSCSPHPDHGEAFVSVSQISDFVLTLKFTQIALLSGPFVLNCYGTVSSFHNLGLYGSWSSLADSPFIVNFRLTDFNSDSSLFPLSNLPQLDTLPKILDAILGDSRSFFFLPAGGVSETYSQISLTLRLKGYSYAAGFQLEFPSKFTIVKGYRSIDVPDASNRPTFKEYSSTYDSYVQSTAAWLCSTVSNADSSIHTCVLPYMDMIDIEAVFHLSVLDSGNIPFQFDIHYSFIKFHQFLGHQEPENPTFPPVLFQSNQVLVISSTTTPTFLGTPLTPSVGPRITLFPVVFTYDKPAMQDILNPLITVGSALFSLQFNTYAGLLTRDTFSMSLWSLAENGSISQVFDYSTQRITPASAVLDLKSLPFSPTSKGVVAIIHYISKPLGDQDTIGDIDSYAWVHSYFRTSSFILAPTCNIAPTDFTQLDFPYQWTTTCQNSGECLLDHTTSLYQCLCKNSFTGPQCETPPPGMTLLDASDSKNIQFKLNLDTAGLLTASPSNTIYFRIGLINLIGSTTAFPPTFNAETDTLVWLSVSFPMQTTDVNFPTSTSASFSVFSHVIPDFVSHRTIVANIPSTFGQTLENPAIFIEPINLPADVSSTHRYIMPLLRPLYHSCPVTQKTQCESCGPNNTNWFSNTGCNDFLNNADFARSSRCSGLTCPKKMDIDYNSCICTCTTQTCKDTNRSTMLYTTSSTNASSKYGKSLYYHQLTREFTAILGLNTLPLPVTTLLHRGGYIDQNVNIAPALPFDMPYVPPVAYEELLVSPMTYTTMDTQSMMITITMTPFDSAMPPMVAGINARYAYLKSKLTTLFSSGIFTQFKFFANLSARLDIVLTPSTTLLNTFQWKKYSSPTLPSQLTTRCQLPPNLGDPRPSLQKCPTVAQLQTSPYWSKCSTSSDFQQIFPLCIDLFDNPTVYSPLPTTKSWCGTSSILYPDFPSTLQLQGSCSSPEQEYSIPDVPALTLSSPSAFFALISGDIVTVSWTVVKNPNPAHTVSFYLRRGSPPPGAFSIFDPLDDEDYDDTNYSIYDDADSFTMDVQQQNAFEKGYSILLGTFSIKSPSVSLTMPVTKTDVSTQVYIFALLNQRKTDPIIPPSSSSLTLMDRNLCAASTCTQIDNQECQRTTGACVCSPLFHPIVDDNGNVTKCVSICDNQCGQGGECEEYSGTCKCSPNFSGSHCEIALNCNTQNQNLCSNNGFVSFVAQQCGSDCTCFGKWGTNGTKPCSQCEYTMFTTPMPLCDELGTSVTRTEKEKCSQCFCKKGYEGSRCATRTMYGTVTFTAPHVDGVDYNQTPLTLSAEATGALVRDLSLSLGVSEDVLAVSQVITTTTTSSPSPAAAFINILASFLFSSQQQAEKINTNAVTFAISAATDDSAMNSLYDSWNNLKSNFDQVPISQTEAQQEVGTPAGVEDAYDPVCVSSPEVSCPTGFDPFIVEGEDPTSPSDDNETKTTSAVIAIVVSIVVAVVIIAFVGGFLVWAKKNNKCCFTKRTKQSTKLATNNKNKNQNKPDNHLELTTSDTTNVGRSQFVTESGAIDLVEVELSPGEKELPAGWKKMRHNVTGHTLYVNYTDMQSQKQSPVTANVPKADETDKAGDGYVEGW